jgi:hypothetical protein
MTNSPREHKKIVAAVPFCTINWTLRSARKKMQIKGNFNVEWEKGEILR